MRFRQLLAVSAVVVVTGCSSAAAQPKTPVVIPTDPVAAIAAAKARLGQESARFSEQTPGVPQLTYTGVVDARTKNWEITGNGYVARRVGTDVYVKMSGAVLDQAILRPATHDQLAAGRWIRTRLPNGRELAVVFNDSFPWDLANPAIKSTDLKPTGDRTFAGTFSLGDTFPSSTPHAKVTAPIKVGLDDQGRFSTISVTVGPDKSDPPAVFNFSDFGVHADIKAPPAADVLYDDDVSSITLATQLF
jgi:hypothetical protein